MEGIDDAAFALRVDGHQDLPSGDEVGSVAITDSDQVR
jgi:hypothetical protein